MEWYEGAVFVDNRKQTNYSEFSSFEKAKPLLINKPPIPQAVLLSSAHPNGKFYGNAFVVDPQRGLLATAKHCVEDCSGRRGLVFWCRRAWRPATVYSISNTADVALIKTDGMIFPNMQTLYWSGDALSRLDPVCVNGWRCDELSNGGLVRKFQCIKSWFSHESAEGELVINRTAADGEIPGWSGSPAFDRNGLLIGLLISYDTRDSTIINLAPINKLAELF